MTSKEATNIRNTNMNPQSDRSTSSNSTTSTKKKRILARRKAGKHFRMTSKEATNIENTNMNHQLDRSTSSNSTTDSKKKRILARRKAGKHFRMNKPSPNNDSHRDTKKKECLYQKTRNVIYDNTVTEVSETNRRITRRQYKEVSKKCQNMSNRSLRAIRRSLEKDNMTAPMNKVSNTTNKSEQQNEPNDKAEINDDNIINQRGRTISAYRRSTQKNDVLFGTTLLSDIDDIDNDDIQLVNNIDNDTELVHDFSSHASHSIIENNMNSPKQRQKRLASLSALKKINDISRTEANISKTDNDITDISINIPFIEPATEQIYENVLNNNTDDQATIFDDDSTLSTMFEENYSLSSKQNLSKHKRKFTATNETTTTCGSKQEEPTSNKMRKICNVDDLVQVFTVPKTIKSSLPRKSQRNEHPDIESVHLRGWNGMVNLTTMCCKQVLSIICPGPSKVKLREHMIRYLIRSEKIHTKNHTKNVRDYKERYNFLVKSLFDSLKVSKKGSIQRRFLRALIVQGIPTQKDLRLCCINNSHADLSNGHNKAQALIDIKKLMSMTDDIIPQKFSRKRYKDEAIEHAVKFILSEDHVRTLSWGSMDKFVSPTETIVLPKLQRLTTRKMMWESYTDYFKTKENKNKPCIGRTSFHILCKELTSSDEVVISSVDYVQALLLTEPIELLQDIIDQMTEPSIATKLSCYLQSLSTFLKYRYPKHITKSDDICCTHGLQFALGRPSSTYDPSKETKKDITCHECRFYSFVCHSVRSAVINGEYFPQSYPEKVEDALAACNDVEQKLQSYMAHKVRCTNQNIAIKSIENNMITKLKESNGDHVQCMMIVDFKMKFEPMSSRETTLDHFGKRGIGWHGVYLMYYQLKEHETDNGTNEIIPVKHSVYIDQIMADSNRQDMFCVFSMLDAALQQIHYNLPFISEVILQSDNANCYQNTSLICSISLLNASYQHRNLKIIKYIHTETQDGKTVLDAHFARCMRFLSHFMRTWYKNKVTKINTPNGLGYALAWKGGIPNVMVQVTKMDRKFVSDIFNEFNPVVIKLRKYFGRINMIHFIHSTDVFISNHTGNDGHENTILEQVRSLKFKIGIQSYSNIDEMSTFQVDIGQRKVTPDEHVENEVHFCLHGERKLESTTKDNNLSNDDSNTGNTNNYIEDEDENEIHIDDRNERDTATDEKDDFTFSNEEQTEINDNPLIDDDDDDDDEYVEYVHTEKQLQKRKYNKPDKDGKYKRDSFISRVKITRIMELGKATPSKTFECKDKKRVVPKVYDNERNDLLAKALRFANHHIIIGGINVRSVDKDDDTLQEAKNFTAPTNKYFVKGWARRNANKKSHGGLYGRKYILNYKDEIESYFDKGKRCSSDKMNPAQMRELLKTSYPNRFRIPSETEIKQEISKLFQGSKKDTSGDDDDADGVEVDNNVQENSINATDNQHATWEEILENIVKHNHSKMKPEEIWQKHLHELRENYKFTETSIPDKATVKRKITSLKAKWKKKALSDLV